LSFQNRLKSFVLRRGRITSNQSRALSEHWDKYILDNEEKLNNIWSQDPSVLDIGFGSGETTAYLAKTKPEMLILGAEVYLSGIGSLLIKANEESLNNIKILNSDIVPFLENKVSDNCFDLILMFYPDPWPKRKHHKRRLLQKDFIDLINKKLKQNGTFYFKTDWIHYFNETKKLLINNPNWRILQKENLEEYLVNLPRTSFENKALQAKRKLNELILQKTY
jgi:tRNA (guanine-N7-)-methyltransferase